MIQLIRDIARALESFQDRQRINRYRRQGYTLDNAKWLAQNDKYLNQAIPRKKKSRSRG